jgi:hypothetical protein
MTYPIDASTGSYDTNSGLSGTYIPEIWAGKLLVKFYAATVFASIANTDYEGSIQNHGDKVLIRTVPDLTINDYEIGQSLNYERPRSANVELLIDQGKYYAFNCNDVEKKQSDVDFVNKWAEDASEQLKIAIDTDILAGVYGSAHADNIGTTAGAISGAVDLGTTGTNADAAETLTEATIIDKMVECGQVLDEQNIPNSNRWFVITAWMATRIKVSSLADASYAGDGTSMMRNGRIGVIDNFELFVSNNVYNVAEGTGNLTYSIFGHKSAITFASQLTNNEMIDNPDDFGQLMRGLQVYGYKVVKPEALGVLVCDAGALT